MSFIDWSNIEFNGDRKGEKKTTCPVCSPTRKNKSDRCLAVNFDTGLAYCHHCEATAVRDSNQSNYELPSQEAMTLYSDKMVDFVKDRGISVKTLMELSVSEEMYFQPKHNSTVNNIVFNYYEGSTLVNKKYRSGAKGFTQSKNTKPIFYNINATIGQKEIYIVEGEFDVLAMHEAGFKNVISVPNGANDNDNYWKESEKYLKSVETFIIGTDNDEKGIKLRDDISHRLGKHKCKFIEWGGKDANDDLLSGVIQKSINSAKSFPIDGVHSPMDFIGDVYDLYDKGLPDTIYPKSQAFRKLNDVFKLVMGQVTVVTGIPSSGKSNFLEWYVLNLIKDHDLKTSIYSPEHSPTSLHLSGFIQKIIGGKFWGNDRIKRSSIDTAMNWMNGKIHFLSGSSDNVPNWDWLLSTFSQLIYQKGIKLFIIDAFNKVLLPKGNKLDMISEVMTKLTLFAQNNGVLVFLVAHPTKMQKNDDGTYQIPGLYDVSGSADFRNQTHNGLVVHRIYESDVVEGKTIVRNLKTKFSFQGEIGKEAEFKYNDQNGRYYGIDGYIDNDSIIEDFKEDTGDIFTSINNNAPF